MNDDLIVRTVRCPICGQLPDLVIGPTQAFCGNDDCRALMFDPSMDGAEQIAGGTELGFSLAGPGGIAQETAAAAAAARPRQVPGSAADDMREVEIRAFLHRHGYRCLPGQCTICDTQA